MCVCVDVFYNDHVVCWSTANSLAPNCQERCPFGLLARLLLWFGEYLPEVQGGGDGGDCMPHRTHKKCKV